MPSTTPPPPRVTVVHASACAPILNAHFALGTVQTRDSQSTPARSSLRWGSRPGAPQQRVAVQAHRRARRERGRADNGRRAQSAARRARAPVRGRRARADGGLAGVAIQHVLATRGADGQGACAPGLPGVTACAAPQLLTFGTAEAAMPLRCCGRTT
jgi:hypothetical protein